MINTAFGTLLLLIKNANKRETMKKAFRKLYNAIGQAFPEFKSEE